MPAVGVQALLQKAEIYHLHNPDTLPIIILLRIFGKKVIYDIHEDFSKKILIKNWIPKLLRRPLAFFVSKSESLISTIATASIATQQDVIERNIRSVGTQSLEPKEHIIVDDGSVDDTGSIADGLRREFPNLRVIRQAHGGAATARNAGIAVATGRFVAFLDSDDVWTEHKLAT